MENINVKISSNFKTHVKRTISAIVLFIFTYIFILILTISLIILSIYLGFSIIAAIPNFFTLMVGIGLISIGIIVLFFLLKFIFESHKIDLSHLVEIKKSDEPRLFEIIEEIANKVNTPYPHKVYLSSEVNASVFYNSSFWSMFFPIRKNLQIGLGLVNSVTENELRAVISHEFGHFSQKTMKLGSYVYNVNQIIYNMLYDNESYEKALQKWANANNYFLFFSKIAKNIIDGIKWVLKKIYAIINKSYSSLSKEMEYHADEISAYINGSEPLKNFLLRANLAEFSLNEVLNFYENKITTSQRSENIFREQFHIMNFISKRDNIALLNSFPYISMEQTNKFNKSKLIIKDQWASHPSTEDRVDKLDKLNIVIHSENQDVAANEIFKDILETQKKLTSKIFDKITFQLDVSILLFEEFIKEYETLFLKNTFSLVFNRYYDSKNPTLFDLASIPQSTENIGIEELFSEDKVDLIYSEIAIKNDIQMLKEISNKENLIKYFDYDGIKYNRDDCPHLISRLEKELEIFSEQIKNHDINIYNVLRNVELSDLKTNKLSELYKDFFEIEANFNEKNDIYIQLIGKLQFVNVETPHEEIKNNLRKIKPLEEQFKNQIKEVLKQSILVDDISKEIQENFDQYLSKEMIYFGLVKYHEENLQILFKALNDYNFLIFRTYFLHKKRLLDYQAELIINHKTIIDL